MSVRSVCWIAPTFLVALTCAAQQPPLESSQAPEVTSSQAPAMFRSATNLVQVPVVVRDRSGHAVGTLRAEDFLLFDSGKLQTISRFSVQKYDSSESLQSHAKNQGATNQAGELEQVGSPPDRFVALLVDDMNLSPVDFIRGRNAALHFLTTLRPDQRVAVYSASRKSTLAFTDDRDQLRKTLENMNSVDSSAHYSVPIDSSHPPCRVTYYNQNFVEHINSQPLPITIGCPDGGSLTVDAITFGEIWHMTQTWGDADELAYLGALQDLVDRMSTMPGQRSILLVSPGIYIPARFQPQFKDTLSRAVRAKVIISGVDARGVLGSGVYAASNRAAPAGRVDPNELGDQYQGGEFMADITSGTGGTYVRNDNDLDGAIRRAESVPEFVYLLAFSPSDLKFDGKRHILDVRLKSPRGFTVQARNGYFADNASSDPVDEAKRQIEEAFFSSQELNGLPVQLRTRFFKDGDNATLTVSARVDATKLPFRKEADRNRDNLTLVVGLFDQNGNFVSAYQKIIRMQLKDATLDAWMKSGIETATDFNVKPGKYLVRLVVRDSEGSSMAEQSTGVDIPW
jgi:VWFA-related protein